MQRGIDLALRDSGATKKSTAATVEVLRATFYTEERVLSDWFLEDRRGGDE